MIRVGLDLSTMHACVLAISKLGVKARRVARSYNHLMWCKTEHTCNTYAFITILGIRQYAHDCTIIVMI